MEGLLLLGGLLIVAMPVIALTLAARALAGVRALQRQVVFLRERLSILDRTIADSRTAGQPLPAKAPVLVRPGPSAKVHEQAEPEAIASRLPPVPGGPLIPEPPSISPTAPAAEPAVSPHASAETTAPKEPPPTPGVPTVAADAEASLEEKLGARIFVWIGAIALALAGAYLVKYTFDQGLLSPPVRVAMGLVFGVVLLIAGEWLRNRSARIAQGVSAAGVADLFASLLAAANLYHLVSPIVGFILLAVVTALAVVLSLRQGPFVAGLGLVGGFLTPVLIRTGEPHPSLFAYLFLLELGLLAVSRRRHWWPLTFFTLVGGMAWAGVWMGLYYQPDDSSWLGLFLLGTVAAFVLAAQIGRSETMQEHSVVRQALTWFTTGLALLMIGALVRVGDFSTLEWSFLGLLGAGCIILGRLNPTLEGLAWLAAGITAAMLLAWADTGQHFDHSRFGMTVLAMGALYAVGAYLGLLTSRMPGYWSVLCVLSAIAYFLIAYGYLRHTPPQMKWGGVCLILAALHVLGAIPIGRRRTRAEGWEESLAALAVGVTVFVSLAAPIELKRQWIAVAWAVEVPALALAVLVLRIRVLRTLAWGLGAMVMIRLLLNPGIFHYPIAEKVILNWLSYGYGIPLLAMLAAAWLFRLKADDVLATASEGAAVALGFALVTLQLRQYFHPGDLDCPVFPLNEWAAFSTAWFAYGLALLILGRRRNRLSCTWAGHIVSAVALVQTIAAQGLLDNPLWWHHPVGERMVINWLLFVYGVPAILAALTAWELRNHTQLPNQTKVTAAQVVGAATLFLVFVLVSLQVRQAFQGGYLDGKVITDAEKYAYSVAWILLGALLLILGIVTNGLVLRYASLVVMLLAVGKVFVFDTAHLRDLYRVVSFLGLGVSLLALAYLYQRLVFRRPGA